MEFTLRCPCGDILHIAQTEAGCAKRCRCGSEFQIPRLSVLRRLESEGTKELPPVRAGEAADRSQPGPPTAISLLSVAQKLQLLAVEGHLPEQTRCLQCELTTEHAVDCFIECELPQVHSQTRFWDHLAGVAVALISPLHGLFHAAAAMNEEPPIVTDEVVVRAPLRLCADCARQLQRDPRRVRELVHQLPLYRPLFRQYPQAAVRLNKC